MHDVEAPLGERNCEIGADTDRDPDAGQRRSDRDEVLADAAVQRTAAGREVAGAIRRGQDRHLVAARAEGAGQAVDVLVDVVRLRPVEGRDEGDGKCHRSRSV